MKLTNNQLQLFLALPTHSSLLAHVVMLIFKPKSDVQDISLWYL